MKHTSTPLWRRIIKIAVWTLMAAVLTVAAVVICAARLLSPQQLTPLVEKAANSMLDADVSIGRVELSLLGKAPFVSLQVDSLTVISTPMRRLRDDGDKRIPLSADTLLTLTRFEGSINIVALLGNKIALRDVIFTEPGINLFTVDEQHSNYLIFKTTSDTITSSGPTGLPSFSINRFMLLKPRPLKFTNLSTGAHVTIALNTLSINSDGKPVYSVEMGGDVDSPALGVYNLDNVNFGLDGGVGWDSECPTELSLDNFKMTADFLEATVNAHVDFGHDIVVRDFELSLGEMGIERILSIIPDSIRRVYDVVPGKFSTDMALSFTARSTAPFNITTDSIPHAVMELRLSEGALKIGPASFRRVGGVVQATLNGNNLDSAIFNIKDLIVMGPATELLINMNASRVRHDPLINGCIKGHTMLNKLPAKLMALIPGAVSGHVTADIDFSLATSMLSPDNFHKININGDIDAGKLYFLTPDTGTMIFANNACFKFGTGGNGAGIADSLLTAVLTVDSTEVITGDADITLTGLKLGVGTLNRRRSADTTIINPIGGGLQLERLNVALLGHSTTIRIREVDGKVSMRRYKHRARVPQFNLDLAIRAMSFGSPTARMMLNGSELHVTAHKLPVPPGRRQIRRSIDSLTRAYPDLPRDSVFARAMRLHRPNPRHRPRVHPMYTDSASEIIYWGTADGVKRILLDWDIRGSITSRRAGLFTTSFPVRNRVRNFNATFNTDSVVLTNVQYKAGSSDFLISGCLSNMRRGFTAPGFSHPIRINFDVVSDTIDVNELAGTAFKGAALTGSVKADSTHHHIDLAELEEHEEEADSLLESELGRMVANAPDSVAPLLIPTNIDLRFDMKAANVRYSDMLFHDFGGQLLAYGGALNLHHLTATSEAGRVNLSALYAGARADDLHFGFGLDVNNFNIARFMEMVPALDSVMPLMHDFSGIINANIAATCDIDRRMDFVLPSLSAAIHLEGDSLELIDPDTYRTIGKWLLFKDKTHNIINHLDVQMTVDDNRLLMYPFIFDIDRYKLGVQGYNDLSMNFNYHIAVLKSPLPFKFGINISGNPDKYKIRLGKARLKENLPVNIAIVDTTRVNLLREIENIFRRGVTRSRFSRLRIDSIPEASHIDLNADTISAADSAVFIREGLIPAPPIPPSDPQKQSRPGRKASTKTPTAEAIVNKEK